MKWKKSSKWKSVKPVGVLEKVPLYQPPPFLHIRCHINVSYMAHHVANLLEQGGLKVENIDEKAGTITGIISRDKVADLWKLRGLEVIVDLRDK